MEIIALEANALWCKFVYNPVTAHLLLPRNPSLMSLKGCLVGSGIV